MYKTFIRPILFQFDPEAVHHFTFNFLKKSFKIPGVAALVKSTFQVKNKQLQTTVMGLNFPNRVGLAAGFDKDALLFNELSAFGFGFIEIGTLTPKGQPGNEKPRLFRLKEDQGVINRMGFNNGGVEMAAKRLQNRKSKMIIGGNIGKNKITPNAQATDDYIACFKALYPVVDYFVVNVSSPNTPGLRELQEKEPLMQLLQTLKDLNDSMPAKKPLALKIAPDLTNTQLDDIIDIAKTVGLDGIIATNTTIDRTGLKASQTQLDQIGAGGLSGAPVKQRSTEVVSYLRKGLDKNIAIIAVGGIFTAADVEEKINAGADLVQVYTGFIYEGPGIVKNINKALIKK